MVKKSMYTKKLGMTVAKSAYTINTGTYHVISGDAKKWTVVSDGRVKAIKAFPTQVEAINFAKKTAIKKTGEVIVHAVSGQIKETFSYVKK